MKLLSPEYCAVIEFAVTGKFAVLNVAVAELFVPAVKVSVPRSVVPVKNSTVPVGVSVDVLIGATVAVSVTVCP